MVPVLIRKGIHEYAEHGLPGGSFLDSCLRNNLLKAVCHADTASLENLLDIMLYISENVPLRAWGSPAIVEAWIAEKREERRKVGTLTHA